MFFFVFCSNIVDGSAHRLGNTDIEKAFILFVVSKKNFPIITIITTHETQVKTGVKDYLN